ncbi:MAG: carbonic anhydrase family protein [Chloroflexi bacterium]|nr:carbonic anhydrase family protein [Chloroflexota bacterium]
MNNPGNSPLFHQLRPVLGAHYALALLLAIAGLVVGLLVWHFVRPETLQNLIGVTKRIAPNWLVQHAVKTSVNPADIVFNYQPSALNILNNGHTIQANYDEGSSIEVDGKPYNLLQFHFHALSEHTINGNYSPMEMHLVHQSDDGNFAVVGVMLNNGGENAAYTPMFDNLPAQESEAETIGGVTVNADDLLPQDRGYYRYNGSFTTPPCTEGVSWFVMSTPVELSDAQISAFEQICNGNYRPVQPLNARTFPQAGEVTPQTLPVSGGQPFPVTNVLVGVGLLVAVAGLLFLYRRKTV